MKIFLITSRPAAVTLIKQAEVLGLCDVRGCWSGNREVLGSLKASFPVSKHCSSWDELFPELNQVDRLITCGDDPAITEAARQLTAQGLTCLHLLDPEGSPAAQFSLTAAWNERPELVFSLILNGFSSQAAALLKQLSGKTSSPLHRIEFIQTVPQLPGEPPTFSEADFDRMFFRATPLFWQLGGDYQEVTSLRIGVQGDRSEQGMITLAGNSVPDATWKLERGPEVCCRLVLKAEDQATAEVTWNPQSTIAEDMVLELSSQEPLFDWNDLLRCGELSATARVSATKRRTIRVQQEEVTERSQFKSQMAAMGCGVLLWAMLGTMLMLFAGTVADPRDREYKNSTRHGFVLRHWEFMPAGRDLLPEWQSHLETIARRWSDTEAAVIVEKSPEAMEELTEQRLDTVREFLESRELRDVRSRTISRELPGQWYESLMRIGWLVVFIPLLVFLLAQGLILAARGPQHEPASQ